jgi:hypothetical protein
MVSWMEQNFFIGEENFRVWLDKVSFIEKSDDDYNSRQIVGIMSSQRKDRQGESVVAKGLDMQDFLRAGHFNDNHSQDTSAIVGYPEDAKYWEDLSKFQNSSVLSGVEGWTCKGYVLKGTKRSDAIWELAKALQSTPNRRLGFSIEGKVIRRSDTTIEKARIRNVAITNCPVNTDATWEVLSKSMSEPEIAMKSLSAGYGISPATQSGGGALRVESLDSNAKKTMDEKKKKKLNALIRALEIDDLMKAVDFILNSRPDFDEDAAAVLVTHLFKKGGI